MSTTTIKNAPKSFWKEIDYDEYIIFKKEGLKGGIKKIKELYFNKKTNSYWPFEWEDAINFLNLIDYEDRIS